MTEAQGPPRYHFIVSILKDSSLVIESHDTDKGQSPKETLVSMIRIMPHLSKQLAARVFEIENDVTVQVQDSFRFNAYTVADLMAYIDHGEAPYGIDWRPTQE